MPPLIPEGYTPPPGGWNPPAISRPAPPAVGSVEWWAAQIQSDPQLAYAYGLYRPGGTQDTEEAAQLAAARDAAVVNYGEVPDTVTGISPAATSLAAKRTSSGLSTTARLQQTHLDTMRTISNALAARGALHTSP